MHFSVILGMRVLEMEDLGCCSEDQGGEHQEDEDRIL